MLKKKKNNKGFTLVELLVVIAIIGILAIVAVPALFKQIDKSKGADISATVASIKSATTVFYSDNDVVPTSIAAASGGTATTDLLVGGYLDSNPDVPNKVTYTLAAGSTQATKGVTLVIDIKGSYMSNASIDKLASDLGVTKESTPNNGSTATIKVPLIKD